MKNVVCFDIGGTSIKYAVINSQGEILFKDKFPTPKVNCNKTIPNKIVEKIVDLSKDFVLNSVGISTAGIIDSEKGIVVRADNFVGYSGTPLRDSLNLATGLEIFVENDVNAVALGEMWMGAAIGHKNFVCIALGTGVGGALVINGDLVRGVNGGAGEIGHTILNENGEACACGSNGCYERYASTSSLIRSYIKKSKELNIEIEYISGEDIMERYEGGEPLANKVVEEFMEHLINGIVSLTHLLDPGLIVIGGGISDQGQVYFIKLNKKLKEKVMKFYADHTSIVQAKLKNDAGLYGACYSALKRGQTPGGNW